MGQQRTPADGGDGRRGRAERGARHGPQPADPAACRRRASPAHRYRAIDPASIASVPEHGGYAGLTRAIEQMAPEAVIDEIGRAGLRGRGGSGYPTADKWRAARAAGGDRRIVIANLMSSDPTALGDRALAEGNPHLVARGAPRRGLRDGGVGGDHRGPSRLDACHRTPPRCRRRGADRSAAGYLVLGTDFSVQVSVQEGSTSPSRTARRPPSSRLSRAIAACR